MIAAALVLFLLAAIDGWLALTGRLAGIDHALVIALAAGRATPAWLAVTHFGDPPVRLAVGLAGVALLLAMRRRRAAKVLAGGLAGALLVARLFKHLTDRPRPTLLPHLDYVASSSFPSGHALGTAVLYPLLALLLVGGRWRVPAVALAATVPLLTGLSRIALAVHWPSDVLAGWLIGVGWVLLCLAANGARTR